MGKSVCSPEQSHDMWEPSFGPLGSALGNPFASPLWAPYGNAACAQDSLPGTPSTGTQTAASKATQELHGYFPDEQVCRRPTTAEYSGGLDKALDAEIVGNRKDRASLDALRKNKDPGAKKSADQLDGNRQQLLDDLKMRSQSYKSAIDDINGQLGNKTPKNPTAEQKALLEQRDKLEKDKNKYSDQQTALQRWHDRGEIDKINEKLKDPKLTADEKTKLLANKKELATGLLSTVKTYQQFDPRWGSTVYGKDKSYTTMTEAGCGPTGLADLMDFADQEDPEGHHSRGEKDPYSPRKMADYATNHGRVKNQGTAGSTMMNDLSGSFPGFSGHDVRDQKGAVESLNNGIPVLFSGQNITGQGGDGKNTRPYGGHFMVLKGVSDDGKDFSVADGGRNSSRNIRRISSQQLSGHTGGFWNVKHQD